eukprot:TRINITY_DN67991_c8_g1_i2.p2 TRINITY_DN67991_c8_g1~~TRINITY_DN67991_c8_g1_i2.p2  ORF type:complete len:124 (+),score=2.72 TRINITY_DN67991_c8_g1_i2:819-1190(+)
MRSTEVVLLHPALPHRSPIIHSGCWDSCCQQRRSDVVALRHRCPVGTHHVPMKTKKKEKEGCLQVLWHAKNDLPTQQKVTEDHQEKGAHQSHCPQMQTVRNYVVLGPTVTKYKAEWPIHTQLS